MNKLNIFVVVPTYNNPKSIQKVVDDILSHGYQLIVVDDGSNPEVKLSPSENLTVIRHEINLGKGMAIITGAKEVKKRKGDYFVALDGDGQHMASQIKYLLDGCNGDNEVIIGARNFDIPNIPNGSKIGRWFSNIGACWNTGCQIDDSLSGFRLYPTSILDLSIKTKKFDWEMEVLVKHAWSGRLIKETVIECYYPTPDERVSHFKKFWDTVAIVMVHVRLLPLKIILKKMHSGNQESR